MVGSLLGCTGALVDFFKGFVGDDRNMAVKADSPTNEGKADPRGVVGSDLSSMASGRDRDRVRRSDTPSPAQPSLANKPPVDVDRSLA